MPPDSPAAIRAGELSAAEAVEHALQPDRRTGPGHPRDCRDFLRDGCTRRSVRRSTRRPAHRRTVRRKRPRGHGRRDGQRQRITSVCRSRRANRFRARRARPTGGTRHRRHHQDARVRSQRVDRTRVRRPGTQPPRAVGTPRAARRAVPRYRRGGGERHGPLGHASDGGGRFGSRPRRARSSDSNPRAVEHRSSPARRAVSTAQRAPCADPERQGLGPPPRRRGRARCPATRTSRLARRSRTSTRCRLRRRARRVATSVVRPDGAPVDPQCAAAWRTLRPDGARSATTSSRPRRRTRSTRCRRSCASASRCPWPSTSTRASRNSADHSRDDDLEPFTHVLYGVAKEVEWYRCRARAAGSRAHRPGGRPILRRRHAAAHAHDRRARPAPRPPRHHQRRLDVPRRVDVLRADERREHDRATGDLAAARGRHRRPPDRHPARRRLRP